MLNPCTFPVHHHRHPQLRKKWPSSIPSNGKAKPIETCPTSETTPSGVRSLCIPRRETCTERCSGGLSWNRATSWPSTRRTFTFTATFPFHWITNTPFPVVHSRGPSHWVWTTPFFQSCRQAMRIQSKKPSRIVYIIGCVSNRQVVSPPAGPTKST